MADQTNIEWTDATWNPVSGCTEVSPGCDHCYAKSLAERFRGTPGHYYEQGFEVVLRDQKLDQPLRWKKPKRIFVNSMSDLFHDAIPDEFIARVFAVMVQAEHHTFQVLTKRHGRMRSLLSSDRFLGLVDLALGGDGSAELFRRDVGWPLANVWLGVSVENQQWADIRIPALLDTPAAVRFLSMEPLLGPVNLDPYLRPAHCSDCSWTSPHQRQPTGAEHLHWVIVGGESGHGARPMHQEWVRSLRDQCTAAGVPFLFKQWGEWKPQHRVAAGMATDPREVFGEVVDDGKHPSLTWHRVYRRVGKKTAGRELDGRTWDQFPEAVAARG